MYKKSCKLINWCSVIFVLLLSISVIQAQTVTGTIKGTVSDTSEAVVPGVSIEIVNVETGLKRTVETSGEGTYQATFMPLGKYTVTAVKDGFGTVIRENVEVSLNQTTSADFKLDPAVTATVTIDEESAPINTTNAQISGNLTSQEILDRPVANQSNFLTLAETFAGFQENPNGGQNNPTLSSGSSVSFNGTGSRGTTFQINGVNNDDSSENQNRQGVSLATIKEFQVITNNFTAEFGRGYGAVVLVQTLSGTNSLKGSAYIFHNNSALNAKGYFNHGPKPVNRRNQYGGTLGFPVFKNKLFGFVSFDRTQNSGAAAYTRDVFLPSEKNEANWFQHRDAAGNLTSTANATDANKAFIRSVINRFPADLIPNDPANRSPRVYVGQQTFNFPDEDYSGRFDWNIRESDTAFLRYQYTRQKRLGDDVIIGERASQNNKQQNIGLTWTHIFNTNLVGEFRYGLGLRTTLADIQAGNDTPVIRFLNNFPAVSGSQIGNAAAFPILRYQTDNQFVYNLSWIIGSKHFLKIGTDLRKQNIDDFADNASRGFYNFNSATCNGVNYGSGFAALINGCVNNFQKGYGPFFLENRLGEYNFYAEDNWKILRNLTLNLGIRYEYVKAPSEAENRIQYGFGDDKDNVEPRIGFAYSPSFETGFLSKLFGKSGESSIRGGYGIYHGRLFQSVFAQTGASVRTNTPNAFYYNQTGNASANFAPTNLTDPTNGFVFVSGVEPTVRYSKSLVVDPKLEMPYTKQWSLTFERQLPWKTALRVSYTGNRGIGLLRYNFGNAPNNDPNGVLVDNHPNNAPTVLYTAANRPAGDPRGVDVRGQILRPAADLLCAGTGLANVPFTTACPVKSDLGPYEYSIRIPRTNERRPDGRFGGQSEVSNTAFTWYDGMQIEVDKRLTNGVTFKATYVWSKSLDTTSEATSFGGGSANTGDSNQTGNDLKASRGPSRSHTPHRFTLLGTYRLPFFDKRRDFVGQALGGWYLSTVARIAHGSTFTVTGVGVDLNLDNFSESRPVILDQSILGATVSDPNTSTQILRTSAFRQAGFADLNCCILGRNTFYADGVSNVDISLFKRFLMPFEGHSLSVRADFFNAFNHVQYGYPNSVYTNAGFGQITSTAVTYSPRNIQLSLRYMF